jgi:hypothetical protein
MKVKPMIGEYEVPGIQRIGTVENRALVEIPVPGLEGAYHQDLGSGAMTIVIEGTLAGDEPRDAFLAAVRAPFAAGEPVDFVADIVTATSVEKVRIADLDVVETATSADSFAYVIALRQHVEPPPSGPGADLGFGDLGDVAAAIAAEAGALVDALGIPDLLGSIPELSDPTPPLGGVLDGLSSALAPIAGVSTALAGLFGPPPP